MYVCMYVYIHVCVYACMYVYMYVWMCVCMYVNNIVLKSHWHWKKQVDGYIGCIDRGVDG